jgi:hypothetical protein
MGASIELTWLGRERLFQTKQWCGYSHPESVSIGEVVSQLGVP